MLPLLLLSSLALAGPAWPSLDADLPKAGPFAEDAALIVAIEDYDRVQDIPGARANASAWQTWLREGLGLGHVQPLVDGDATRTEILKEAERAAQAAGPGGRVWVIFIGHGAPDPATGDGLLLGADVRQTPDSIAERGVSQQSLLALAGGRGAPVIAVIDACYSGRTESGPLMPGVQPLVPVTARVAAESTLLLAARSDQVAGALPGGSQPAFSYLVLGALRGWADIDGDGAVRAHEVQTYTEQVLSTHLNGRTQSPELAGRAETVLAQLDRPEAAPDIAAIVAEARLRGPAPLPKAEVAAPRHRSRGLAIAGGAAGLLAGGALAYTAWSHGAYLDEPDAAKADALYEMNRVTGASGYGLVAAATGLGLAAVVQWEW
ncbi:caspase family protein [Myxococcota bacterium]|nr:caspase family protein [Myxococcota bacterium]